MLRRPYHHGDLREDVLRRALVKIESDGLAALSLRDLARDCGVSPSAPQRHFATKDDLLSAMAVRGYDDLGDIVAGLSLTGPVDKALTRFAGAYIAYVIEHPVLIGLMYSRRFDYDADAVRSASLRAFRPVDELLDMARARGEIVNDARLVGTHVRVFMRGLATSFSTGALGPADKSLVRRMVSVMVSGLRPH